MGLPFEAARVLRSEIHLEKTMISNVLTLASAHAANGLPKRSGDFPSHCRHLRGLAQ